MSSFTERGLIADIRRKFKASGHPDLIKGVGDDCAVLRRDERSVWLVSVDTLVEGVHFDNSYHSAELLGRKTASVNISDIAAMGGKADFMLLSAALPENCSTTWMNDFFDGIQTVLQESGVVLVGGDTVKNDTHILLSVTILGSALTKHVVYRSNAKQGDHIWVSGVIGDAAAGLALCQKYHGDLYDIDSNYTNLVNAHLNPSAQLSLGRKLGESGLVHAMIDISDGLATDLAHICEESRVGAVIEAKRLPLSGTMQKAAELLEISPVDFAVSGGEDYQLLFIAPPENEPALRELVDTCGEVLTYVGHIVAGDRVTLHNNGSRDITFQGYQHFSTKKLE